MNDDDAEMIEESSAESYEMHSALLSKGFALDHAPTVQQALDGAIPFSCQSQERIFLKNLVNCAADTAGGRLARWLQPESYVDVDKCRLSLGEEEFRYASTEKRLFRRLRDPSAWPHLEAGKSSRNLLDDNWIFSNKLLKSLVND